MPTENTNELRLEPNEVIENVKVAVRCRPLTQHELQQSHNPIVQIDKQAKAVLVANPASKNQNEPFKCYSFDEVFDQTVGQLEVYDSIGRPIVDNVLRGFNGTIFAYGQTGTGKTFTMSGDAEQNIPGIIQLSFSHIFDHISKSWHDKRFLVRISYMEIYNEEVRDLLARPGHQKSHSLEIKERQDVGVYVKDLLHVTVANAEQCMRIIQFGNANRQIGKTAMNEQSSRSHTIFTITIECSETMDNDEGFSNANGSRQMLTQGKLSFVDLAGSERQSKTNAQGERLKEATKINLSLSTLSNVICALAEHGSHIPYRNSKLTRILSDSLGGNSKTCMIANIGPADYNYEETISTLRYASRAKRIQNVTRINIDPKDALLRRFQDEIEQLKRELEEIDVATSDIENDSAPEDEEVHMRKQQNVVKKREEELQLQQQEDGLQPDEIGRRRLAEDLLRRDEELRRNRREREKLAQKLEAIERQIIVGGENMFEKAQQQTQLLEESSNDLERAIQSEKELHERYRNQQLEHQDIEERNNTMQEQAHGLSKKLKKVWSQYMGAKGELHDQETEHHRETEALLESVRQLQRELLFAQLVLDQSVPEQQQRFIERQMHWDETAGDWQLRCIAYTGNNIQENNQPYNSHHKVIEPQLQPLFMSYAELLDTNLTSPNASSSNHFKTREREAARIRKIFE